MNGPNNCKHGPGLLPAVAIKLKPTFKLGHEDLLTSLLHGLAQNQNESFNSMIWDRVKKSLYVSFSQFQFGVYDAVANFNIRCKASILIFQNTNTWYIHLLRMSNLEPKNDYLHPNIKALMVASKK